MGCFCIRPYLGAGIGFASERRRNGSSSHDEYREYSSSSDNRRTNFAWQLIAGLAYPLNDCIDLDLAYRFFQTTRAHANNHGLTLGFNYNF
jgi:opacity protein-like surface antigen